MDLPLDIATRRRQLARRVALPALAGLTGVIVLPNARRALNFVQLGEMAGLGTVSPVLHQLLHRLLEDYSVLPQQL